MDGITDTQTETSKPAHGDVLHLHQGAQFSYNNRNYVLVSMADVDTVIAREIGTNVIACIQLGGVEPALPASVRHGKQSISHDLLQVSATQWEAAASRLQAIMPLLQPRSRRAPADYEAAARAAGVNVRTIYRYVEAYRETGRLTSLIPTKRPGGRGKGRLDPRVDAIITQVLHSMYLKLQKPSLAKTVLEIRRLCHNAQLPKPSAMTVRKRVEWLDNRTKVEQRHGSYAAKMLLDPIEEWIQETEWPLQLVMMDHTELPCIIVHDITRVAIMRPWLTLAIDVETRVVVGMYLSLEAPSALSVGACLVHSILPKEKWLREIGVPDVKWPVYGVMDNIHTDNALEFRGYFLKKIALEYGIHADKRPVKKPNYGGHIERLMGTMTEMLKAVPGTTFSNPKEKGEYDSEKEAALSFQEMERWLALTIEQYHNTVHSELGTSPLEAWRDAILGRNGRVPRGPPPERRLDDEKVYVDFLPFETRVISNQGIEWDVVYYHDVLRAWIANSVKKGGRDKFVIRRDPRDISRVYVYDEDQKRYHAIPYRDTGHPAVSIWEYRAARKEARKHHANPDEALIFEILTRKRELVEESTKKTKAALRVEQRRKENEKASKRVAKQLPKTLNIPPAETTPVIAGYDPNEIEPLTDE